MPTKARSTLRLLSLSILCCLAVGQANGDEAADASIEKPTPVTTSNPEIPTEHLELLVKPLTKEELVVEADGWRDLLKANAQAIAINRIGVQQKREEVTEAEQTLEAAEEETEVTPVDVAEETDQVTEEIEEATEEIEEATEEKQDLAETLAVLQREKDELVTRLNVVIDELEEKGGEVESYRQYIAALTGIAVEVSDASTVWTVFLGWVTSEQGGQRWGWNLVRFLVIVIAFYFGASIIAGLVRHGAKRVKGTSQLLVTFLGKFVKQLILVIGIIVALSALEVNVMPLLAAVGAAGFIIGFALQDTLSNFASGLLILAYRPFDVNDVIEAAGVSGKVDSVSMFSTHILTFDNKVMIVPNNDIWGGIITNASARDTRRVDLVFGIGYDDDIEQAAGILRSVVEKHELVLDQPEPIIEVNELADSSINFVCRPWTKTGDYWTVYWDITRAVKEEFDRNGISIPFPQRDIHVYQQTVEATPTLASNSTH